MKIKDLIIYIKKNLSEIFSNLNLVFGINTEEFQKIIKNLVIAIEHNDFLNNMDINLEVFSLDNLINLKKLFRSLNIDNEITNQIIIKSPIIILFDTDLSSIYAIYKNNEYKGYCVLKDNKNQKYNYNKNIDNNVYINNYLVDMMINSLNRKDIVKENEKISNYRMAFQKLKKEYILKNYYFKK